MSPRPFVPWSSKVLRQPAAQVAEITPDIQALWQDMIDTMEAMPGLGLAAPQIGVSLRLAVVDASDDRGWALRMANPELLAVSDDSTAYDEGSPNLPGVSAKITRPSKVTVRYLDHHGMIVRKDLEGLWARSVQHQIDHLNGTLYIDHLSKTKRAMLLKRAAKMAKAS